MKAPKQMLTIGFCLLVATALQTAVAAQETDSVRNVASTNDASNVVLEKSEPSEESNRASAEEKHGMDRGPLVSIGRDVELKAGDSAEVVVVIGGSAKIRGKVQNAAVAIWGDLDVEGEVGDTAVAIMGDLKVGPKAKIQGQAVAVGGRVDAADTATIRGRPVTVDFPMWLKNWFNQCLLKLRPLAPQVGWVWGVAGIFLLLYLFVALVFPAPVAACVTEVGRRPATTFLFGLLAKLLVPVVALILSATGIGLAVVPFLLAALLLAAVVGKTALLEYLGLQLGRQLGLGFLQKPLIGLLFGAIIIALFYMVPVLGLLVFMVVSVWGLGCAVTAAAGGFRRELPEKATRPQEPLAGSKTSKGQPQSTTDATPSVPGDVAGSANPTAPVSNPLAVPILPDTLSLPYAGFWERMGAAFLDIVLVSLLGRMIGGPPWALVLALAYFTGLWAWKGTTIGGIVLGLKIARVNGQPLTFSVALVRSLTAAFSIIVLFLGFLWIAWDKEKQAWHDKVAGTVVLRQPRGTPLVCV